MSRRGENIYKRKDGRWEGRYIKERKNKKIQYGYVYAGSYKEVKEKLIKTINNAEKMSDSESVEQPQLKDDYFQVIAKEWLDSVKPRLKESSIVKYTNVLDSYLLPEFRKYRITEINRSDVNAFSCRLLISGGVKKNGLSPKTVTSIISVLKNIFDYALQEKSLFVVDIHGIAVKQPQKPMRILSRTEQQNLSRYLCSDLTPCNLGILVCMYTGLRIGEICALKWDDISFDEQYLYVHQTMQRIQKLKNSGKKTSVQISTPKSDCSIRKIPIPDDIFRLIVAARKPGDAFFLTGMAHSYMEPRTLQNRFKETIRRCNIKEANFHALRHTFATRCVELGFDVKSLSEILGHASVNITMNRYVHPSMELKQKNMNKLSDLLTVR